VCLKKKETMGNVETTEERTQRVIAETEQRIYHAVAAEEARLLELAADDRIQAAVDAVTCRITTAAELKATAAYAQIAKSTRNDIRRACVQEEAASLTHKAQADSYAAEILQIVKQFENSDGTSDLDSDETAVLSPEQRRVVVKSILMERHHMKQHELRQRAHSRLSVMESTLDALDSQLRATKAINKLQACRSAITQIEGVRRVLENGISNEVPLHLKTMDGHLVSALNDLDQHVEDSTDAETRERSEVQDDLEKIERSIMQNRRSALFKSMPDPPRFATRADKYVIINNGNNNNGAEGAGEEKHAMASVDTNVVDASSIVITMPDKTTSTHAQTWDDKSSLPSQDQIAWERIGRLCKTAFRE
jgi:hypothetical protein